MFDILPGTAESPADPPAEDRIRGATYHLMAQGNRRKRHFMTTLDDGPALEKLRLPQQAGWPGLARRPVRETADMPPPP